MPWYRLIENLGLETVIGNVSRFFRWEMPGSTSGPAIWQNPASKDPAY